MMIADISPIASSALEVKQLPREIKHSFKCRAKIT
jgi:hypothetical protein